MAQLFKNAARSALQASILAADTSLTVDAGLADLFPVATTGASAVGTPGLDYFKAVLQDTSGNIEIIYVRTRALGVATFTNVQRGQEGTTARNYAAGSIVGLRLTAADHENALADVGVRIAAATSKATPVDADTLALSDSAASDVLKKLTWANLKAAVLAAFLGTQAEQEAGASVAKFVTPGRQQYHPSAVKVWAEVDIAGAASASYNVASVTDVAVGWVGINFTTAFSSVSYAPVVSVQANQMFHPCVAGTRSATRCDFQNFNSAGALAEPAGNYSVLICGDQ